MADAAGDSAVPGDREGTDVEDDVTADTTPPSGDSPATDVGATDLAADTIVVVADVPSESDVFDAAFDGGDAPGTDSGGGDAGATRADATADVLVPTDTPHGADAAGDTGMAPSDAATDAGTGGLTCANGSATVTCIVGHANCCIVLSGVGAGCGCSALPGIIPCLPSGC